jgi:hypothetical protein
MVNEAHMPHVPDTLNSRQDLMGDKVKPIPQALVIGVGGVGSYIAVCLAMTGTKDIMLVDPDIVEESNRNRVLFRYFDTGIEKVNAMESILTQLRRDINVVSRRCRVEDLGKEDKEFVSKSVVFDCRDSVEPLPDWVPRCIATGGYDGTVVSLHTNPDLRKVFTSDVVRYTITPSYCVPPMLIASLVTLYATCPELQSEKERISTFDIRTMFDKIFDKNMQVHND